MTLVEMIVTIAVFAIAGLILVAGFSTVIKHMGNATLVKNTSNDVMAVIESEQSEGKTTKEVNVKVTFENGYSFDDKVMMSTVKQNIDDGSSYQVSLKKFNKDNTYIDTTKVFYEQVKACMEEWIVMTPNQRQTIFNEAKAKLEAEGITINASKIDWVSNDNLRWFFTVVKWGGMGYPEIDREIIEECNQLYLQRNPSFLTNEAYFRDRKVYMKPYYLVKKQYVVLYGVIDTPAADSNAQNGWRTRLIYNPEDNHWYYKVFRATSNSDSEDSFFGMSNFTQSGVDDRVLWEQLLIDFKDTTKWQRIDIGQ